MNLLKELLEIKEPDAESWLKRQHITGSVDINGSIEIKTKIDKFPVKFGEVSGHFDCGSSMLTSLEGAPREVGGDFYCGNNRLTSLEGAPREVSGHFDCGNNRLKSKELATKVGGKVIF